MHHIVAQALASGMANGRVPYHRKADTKPRKAANELRPEGVSEYLAELNAAVEADRKLHEKKPLPGCKKTLENAVAVKNTKVSTNDPESGLMHRDKKPQGYFYLDHSAVDGKHDIITDTLVTPGNVHDSQPFIAWLKTRKSQKVCGTKKGMFTMTLLAALFSLLMALREVLRCNKGWKQSGKRDGKISRSRPSVAQKRNPTNNTKGSSAVCSLLLSMLV